MTETDHPRQFPFDIIHVSNVMQGPDESERRLRVIDLAFDDPLVRLGNRHPMHFEYFRGFRRGRRDFQSRGEIEMHDLTKHARRGRADAEAFPLLRLTTRFLDELALCGRHRRLIRFELAGRQLPEITAHRMSMLVEQAHAPFVIERNDRRAAGMMNDLERRSVPVGQGDVVDCHRDHATAKFLRAVV